MTLEHNNNQKGKTMMTVRQCLLPLLMRLLLIPQTRLHAEERAITGAPGIGDKWKTLMTVAERKRDAQNKLLPLQSYDETVRRGIAFLLNNHLKWFKGTTVNRRKIGVGKPQWR